MLDTAHTVAHQGWFEAANVTPIGEGHINDTFIITPQTDGQSQLHQGLLQKINQEVFVHPKSLMNNLERVVAHINGRVPGWVPTLIPTNTGGSYLQTADGEVWRMWEYRSNTQSLTSLNTEQQMHACGFAFGRTQQLLLDLPTPPLAPAIEGFHELEYYLKKLAAAVTAPNVAMDDADRERIRALRSFVEPRLHWSGWFKRATGYIHGDCKIDNLLFSQQDANHFDCVVDLDTIMQGHWAWDFGDLIRSAVLSTPTWREQNFATVLGGFAEGAPVPLNVEDVVRSPAYLGLNLGVRFLTDFLQGNCYFKVSHPKENLDRAEAQFKLVERFERSAEEWTELASRLISGRANN